MKAITIWQPYAQLIVTGRKLVENRVRPFPWRSAIGQRIAIHAGLSNRGIEFVGNNANLEFVTRTLSDNRIN
jgi:hypothetical protein